MNDSIILNKGQQEAIEKIVDAYKKGEESITISGAAGVGKANPVTTSIPTPQGIRQLKDLKVGDYVFDRHGKPTKVLGIFPQGKQEVYEVTLKDGRSAKCSKEHLWSYWTSKDNLHTKTTEEMLETGLYTVNEEYRYYIPTLTQPVEFTNKYTLSIDPYVMGTIIRKDLENKTIPADYKYVSIKDRYSLIQGLLNINNITDIISFVCDNITLIKDLQEVLYSLGYTSIINHITETSYSLNMVSNEENLNGVPIINIQPLGYKEEMLCIKVDNSEELFLINDYIVTHNTTIIETAIAELQKTSERILEVAYIAPTGKAAAILREKGNYGAKTIHKFLYNYRPMGENSRGEKQYIKYRKDWKGQYPDVIVVDEISMVDKEMIADLRALNIFTIYCGDNEQLPPVSQDQNNHILDAPDITLTEIMRQANGSDIIDIATDIRLGKSISYGAGRDYQILPKSQLNTGMLLWADVVICATNKTRKWLNKEIRKLKGYEESLCEGEQLICLHNYDKILSVRDEEPLVNGTVGIIKNLHYETIYYTPYFYGNFPIIDLYLDNGDWYENLILDSNMILNEKPFFSWSQIEGINKYRKGMPKIMFPLSFTYCQAVTCHKLQGSSAPKILIYEEQFPYDKEEHRKWLYTACTRASEKFVLLR